MNWREYITDDEKKQVADIETGVAKHRANMRPMNAAVIALNGELKVIRQRAMQRKRRDLLVAKE